MKDKVMEDLKKDKNLRELLQYWVNPVWEDTGVDLIIEVIVATLQKKKYLV